MSPRRELAQRKAELLGKAARQREEAAACLEAWRAPLAFLDSAAALLRPLRVPLGIGVAVGGLLLLRRFPLLFTLGRFLLRH